jgi:hypothetical protein
VTVPLGRLLRTASHLRPSQVGWRLVHATRLRLNKVKRSDRGWQDESARFVAPVEAVEFDAAPLRNVADSWRAGSVEYLALAGDRRDWHGEGRPKLWRYERQYHSELVALAAVGTADRDESRLKEACDLVAGWAEACPQPRGDAWEPYPVARRILNWSLAAQIAPALAPVLAPGIAGQVRFLARHLEHHLLGNHLICDATALVVGAAAVNAEGMDRFRALGESLLARELERQVLPDGGYGERTAQYHELVLRDVLVAIGFSRARGRIALDPRIEAAARAMSEWLAIIARGERVPYLNDSAPDAAPPVSEVLSLARALGFIEGSWDAWLGRVFGLASPPAPLPTRGDVELPHTGWSIVREGSHELLFEHGPIGPDEQPGHGHSDALSFELFWDGHPIVVDTGDTTYDIGAIRDFERSAAAHSTVTVGGEGPDELWAAFRVGARGKVTGGRRVQDDVRIRVLEGSVRAPGGWVHRRRIVYWPGEALVVLDRVDGARDPVQSHLPLDPSCAFEADVLRFPGGQLRLQVLQGSLGASPREGWVGEGFGRRKPRATLTFFTDPENKIAYSLVAPGRMVSIDERYCTIEGPSGSARVELPGKP